MTGSNADSAHADAGFDAIPFMRALGVRLVHAREGRCELRLALEERHLNSWGVAHGGVVMSLLDVAMARAGRSLEPAPESAMGTVTVEMKTSFFAPARGELRALGRVLHRSVTMAYCEAELLSVERGCETLAAKAMGTFKFLRRLDAAARIK